MLQGVSVVILNRAWLPPKSVVEMFGSGNRETPSMFRDRLLRLVIVKVGIEVGIER